MGNSYDNSLDFITYVGLIVLPVFLCPTAFLFQVVVVELEYNRITTSEEIPPIPEPELSSLRGEIMKLLCPNVVGIDQMMTGPCNASDQYPKVDNKPWGEAHDFQLR